MTQRILVTGGAGFLGSHLCLRLVNLGCSVICMDNFCTGSLNNVQHLKGNRNFRILHHDVTDPLDLEVDQIYNLACPASPYHYQLDPIQTTKTNVYGAMNMLQLARAAGARILQASTSEIYGDPLQHPQFEEYWGNVNPVGIRSCYDEGKRCAETLFFDFARVYGVDIKVARIFNTYGPKMRIDDGRVISNFIVAALRGRDLEINGTGSQTRSFCYVDDLIDGLITLMNCESFPVSPVNLGNPQEVSISELASLIIRITSSNSKISYRDLPKDDPCRRRPTIEMAINHLSWQPKVTLETGLARTVSYFREFSQPIRNDFYDRHGEIAKTC